HDYHIGGRLGGPSACGVGAPTGKAVESAGVQSKRQTSRQETGHPPQQPGADAATRARAPWFGQSQPRLRSKAHCLGGGGSLACRSGRGQRKYSVNGILHESAYLVPFKANPTRSIRLKTCDVFHWRGVKGTHHHYV